MAPPTSTVNTLAASVGRKGTNRPEDVVAVQRLLNKADAAIKEDGDCGRGTISAIEDFQRNWTSHPDGRVDPTGTTWLRLAEAKLKTLVEVCQKFMKKFPDLTVGIGDMSFSNGAAMSPHKTHRNGRNADIRPLRTDGKQRPVTITDAEYSRERTKALVELFRSETNFKSILFNDAQIAGVTSWEGHDNHLHVSMKQ
jgi:peptidoglycan hydrolase-like protein with peptidoglycan-binding domain